MGTVSGKTGRKTKIPNLFPDKKELLEQQDMLKEIEKMQKKTGYKGVTTDDMLEMVGEEDIGAEKN